MYIYTHLRIITIKSNKHIKTLKQCEPEAVTIFAALVCSDWGLDVSYTISDKSKWTWTVAVHYRFRVSVGTFFLRDLRMPILAENFETSLPLCSPILDIHRANQSSPHIGLHTVIPDDLYSLWSAKHELSLLLN